jgi:hypothetical protein
MVALLCVSGFIINNTVAMFWVDAYQQEKAIINDIRTHAPKISPGTTLILDGTCPYIGPAIVFDNQWDLSDALKYYYDDPTISADVVRPNLTITETGLSSYSYGVTDIHPYGDKLLLYNFQQKLMMKLTDADATRHYFQMNNPHRDNGCAPGSEGIGVEIF